MFLNQLINDLLFVKPKSNPKASPSTLHHQEKANFFKRTNYWCTWSCISRDTCQRTCTDTNPLLGLGCVPFCRFHTYSKKKKNGDLTSFPLKIGIWNLNLPREFSRVLWRSWSHPRLEVPGFAAASGFSPLPELQIPYSNTELSPLAAAGPTLKM